MGEGMAVPCDALPLEMDPCPTCGFKIPFIRSMMMLHTAYIAWLSEKKHSPTEPCTCANICPICYPMNLGARCGLMWVGRQYTPSSFVKEARKMGISKAISQIPKKLELGKTWVFLAHRKVPFYREVEGMRIYDTEHHRPAIFYAFIPSRIEKLIWRNQATEETLKELKERGITAIIVPDGDQVHA